MDDCTRWLTVSVTALPTPLRVAVSICGETSNEIAVAMLHQRHYLDASIDRIVLGVLNRYRGEIEAVVCEDDANADPGCYGMFVDAQWPECLRERDDAPLWQDRETRRRRAFCGTSAVT